MPTWGILLGLVVEERPRGRHRAPAVHRRDLVCGAPAAARGCGIGDREHALRTRVDAALDDAVLYSTHPSMFREPALRERYDDLAGRCRLQRWGGDCYAFALVAQGGIDLMIDSCLMPYDIVPLVPIIEEAGGVVTDLQGRVPLAGGTVIAAANRRCMGPALAIMRAGRRRRDTRTESRRLRHPWIDRS